MYGQLSLKSFKCFICFFYIRRIDFRLVENLEQVLHSLDVTPHQPINLCAVTSSPSQLVYLNNQANNVYQVDCRTTPPRFLQDEIHIEYSRWDRVLGMCTSGDLLVVVRYKGVFAYALNRGKLKWRVSGRLPGIGELKWRVSGKLPGMQCEIDACGVTADEQGNLFVLDDINRCVYMMSAQDAVCLGVLVREGKVGFGRLKEIIWHSESASLVVAHGKEGVCHLSVFSHQE